MCCELSKGLVTKLVTGIYLPFLLLVYIAVPANALELDTKQRIDQLTQQLHGQLQLSKSEKEWLNNHPVIRVGVDAGYAPYSFLNDKGAFIGVAPDYLKLLSDVLGVSFQPVKDLTWPQIVAGAKDKSLDVIATAVITPERQDFLHFSQMYLPTPLVIMTRKQGATINSAEQLGGRKVALVKGYSSSQRVLKEHPDIISTLVETPIDGLSLLATGEVDAYVGVLGVNYYLAQQFGLSNLKIASRYDLKTNGQRFAVRKDWDVLRDILDKVLGLMSPRDHNLLMGKWVPLDLTGLALDYTETPPLVLTAEEQAWLNAHPVIKIGVMNNWPPMDYVDAQGEAIGIGAQFINALNQRLDGRLKIISGDWATIYASTLKKELDALAGITPRKSREVYFNFTKPYLTVPHVIFARRGTPYLSNLTALSGKKVALEQGFFLADVIKQKYPLIKVTEHTSTSDALAAVSKGDADAYIGNRAVAMYVLHNELITNLEEQGKITESASVNALGVAKEHPILRNILQKALDNISVKERLSILQDWVEPTPLGNIKSIELSLDEWEWLDKHPVIKVKGSGQWYPIEFGEGDEQKKGIAVEYLELMSKLLGVQFEYLDGSRSDGQPFDLISAISVSKSGAQNLIHTPPYLSLPAMIFTRDDISYISNLSALNGKKIAVVKGRQITELIQNDDPSIELIEFNSIPEALDALQRNEVFAYIGSILVTSQYLRMEGFTNIRVSGQVPYHINIGMAARSDWPELARIINKALSQITDTQKNNIAAQWIGVQVREAPDYSFYWRLLSVAVLIIALFLGWNWYLQRVNAAKSREIRLQNEELARSQRSLAEAQRVAHLGSWSWEFDKKRFIWSEELNRMLGTEKLDKQGVDQLLAHVHPEDREFVLEIINYSRENSEPVNFEHRVIHSDGTVRYVEQHTDLSSNAADGSVLTGTVLDITARKRAEHEVRKLSHAFENSPISIAVTDNKGYVEYVNPYFSQMTGYSSEEVVDTQIKIIPDYESIEDPGMVTELWDLIKAGKVWRGENRNQRKDGELYWESVTVAPVLNEVGEFTNILILKQDITQQKKITAELFREANFSALTKQPNRAFILSQADMKIMEGTPVALMLIDMLNIKRINDTLGVEAGDSIIREAAERLNLYVEPAVAVGHLGGGEFLILMETPRKSVVEKLVQNINQAFKEIFVVAGQSIHQGICIGISLYPEDARSPQQLLSNAYTAVTQAKKTGSYDYAYFSEHFSRDAQDSLHLEGLLSKALENDELELHFQPKVDAMGNFRGAEALLRWVNAELGFIPPGRFVPIAEQSNLILNIGRWVIEQSCKYASLWREEGVSDFSVSINMSPKQFYDQGIIEFISTCLTTYGLKGSQVEIEVTEGLFMEGEAFVREQISALKSLGVSLAMDDFGTGYSSLQYLRSYPFDTLKIDRSFVMELPDSKGDANLVQAIIKMGRSLGLSTVAEGVETIEQAEFLRKEGCDLIQGYLFAKPMPQSEFIEWLKLNQVRIG